MIEKLDGLDDPHRIDDLRERGTFFWIDASLNRCSREDLAQTLRLPDHALEPLLEFESDAVRSKLHADGEHVIFAFSCYLEGTPRPVSRYRMQPVEVHVLVCGDYLLTLHRSDEGLSQRLDVEVPAGRSEQYTVYAVLDAMMATAFGALNEIENTLEGLQQSATDLKAARRRLGNLSDVNAQLAAVRRRAAPQRGISERISFEVGAVEGLERDNERYFERIGQQLNRLVEAIDAAANAMATLIDIRLNETTYWLTVVATIFLPLTFVTGFFGMNFGWMVDQIDTQLAFWLLGIGSLAVGVALILRLIVRGSPVRTDRDIPEWAHRSRSGARPARNSR